MPYGIITNCAAVFLGGILGAVLKKLFSTEIKRSPAQYLWSVGHHHGNQPYYHVKKVFQPWYWPLSWERS